MNKPLQRKTGSASLIAMLLTGAMTIMMLTMLERIIPASKNTKGIENSASATYVALSGIEKSLDSLNIGNPGHHRTGGESPNMSKDVEDSNGKKIGTGSIKETSGIIPMPGIGNSDYDKNWNKITQGKPVQIFLTKSFIDGLAGGFNDVKLDLRVPRLGTDDTLAGGSIGTTFSGTTLTGAIINLILTNESKNLVPNYKCSAAECGGIKAGAINTSTGVSLGNLQVQLLENAKLSASGSLTSLIDSNKTHNGVTGKLGCQDGCMLKLFVVNRLLTQAGSEIPYLEYRIRKSNPTTENNSECGLRYNSKSYLGSCVPGFSFEVGIPLQYAEVSGVGRLGPYEQKLSRHILQITTGDAFDFTVIQ